MASCVTRAHGGSTITLMHGHKNANRKIPRDLRRSTAAYSACKKKRCVDTQHSTPRKKDVERKMELIRSIDFLKLQMKTNTSSKVSSQSKYLAHIKIQISTKPQDIRKIIKN